MLRLVRDLFVEAVWAGALTALALHGLVLGLLLLAAGLVLLFQVRRGRTGLLFGARSQPTSTPDGDDL